MEEMLVKLLAPIALAHVIALVAIIIVIKRLLLSDTMNAVRRIRHVEAEVRKKEEGIRKQIDEHEKEFEKRKAEAEAELVARREEGERELAQIRDRITAEAEQEARSVIERAKGQESRIREEIERDMEQKAVEYGAEVFKLVIGEEVTAELNKHFVKELLDAIEEIDAANITADAASAEFKCSHPLDPEQRKRLESILSGKFGAEIKVEEQVDKDLLAGLSFKLGSLEIDGSLLSRYKEAAAEIKKTVA